MAVSIYGETGLFWRGTSTNVAVDAGTGDNRLLLVFFGGAREGSNVWGTGITGVTYNGVSLTRLQTAEYSTGSEFCHATVFYLIAPASSSNTLSVTSDDAGWSLYAYALAGVSQTTPIATSANQTGGNGTYLWSAITNPTNGYIFDGASNYAEVGLTGRASGQTQNYSAIDLASSERVSTGDLSGDSRSLTGIVAVYATIQPPQDVTVTLLTPAATIAAAYLGTVDDGNINVFPGYAKADATAVVGGVLLEEPIIAEMHMEI